MKNKLILSLLIVVLMTNFAFSQIILFEDNFDASTVINTSKWTNFNSVIIGSNASNEPTAPYSLILGGDGSAAIHTQPLDLSGQQTVTLSFYWNRGAGLESPDSGEYLRLYYKNSTGSYIEITTGSMPVNGNGSTSSTFTFYWITLPSAALHSTSQFRFTQNGSSCACDYFAVDDFKIEGVATADLTPNLTSATSFEAGQDYTPQISVTNIDNNSSSDATNAFLEVSLSGNTVYLDTIDVPILQALEDTLLSFDTFSLYKGEDYQMKIYTDLTADADKSNDTLTTILSVNGDIALNEFLPSGLSAFDPTFTEFFEIANTSNSNIFITNWTIQNSSNQIITVASSQILANSNSVFVRFGNAVINGGTPFDYVFTETFVLDDVSDFIVIRDDNGILVDSVSYDATWNPTQGEAFERKNVKLNGNFAGNWCKGTVTYGTEGNKGSPGATSTCSTPIAEGAVSVSNLNFGNVVIFEDSTLNGKIYSLGPGDLVINSITFNANDFTTDLVPQTILAGDSLDFSVTFSPTAQGLEIGDLTVHTNDWNSPDFSLDFDGTGVCYEIDLAMIDTLNVFETDTLVAIDVGSGFAFYSWSNGSTGQVLYVNTSDTYIVTVTDFLACVGTDTTVVIFDDIIPPSKINGFQITSNTGTSVTLEFVSTGDDSTWGTATNYELRYLTSEITEQNFSTGTLVSSLPIPAISGTVQSKTITGLTSGTQYYFGIRAIDNFGNASPIATVQTFERPVITSISDVGNDNGGFVRINFDASPNDYTQGTGIVIGSYSIFRKSNSTTSPSKNQNQITESLPTGNWVSVGTVLAFAHTDYTAIVPTVADSNGTGVNSHDFLVLAQDYSKPWQNVISNVVNAYSIDNIAPQIPPNQNFTDNGNGTTSATWEKVTDSDLAFYKIYAQLADGTFIFVAQETPTSTQIQNSIFNNFVGAIDYSVSSVDVNGNESLPFFNRISDLKIDFSGNDVILTWTGKSDATNYKIFRDTNIDFSNAIEIGTFQANGNSPNFVDSNALANQKYYYFVTWEN